MKKAKRSLIFSLLSLVFALAITATSTYAWFMVNTTVEAQNMQVGVKSDATWLVISKTSGNANLGSVTEQDFALSSEATVPAVLPAMYDQTGTAQGTWKNASGTSYTNGAASGGYAAVADPTKHYVHFTFYVGVTDTTAVAATNLKVTQITVSNNATSNPDNTFLPSVSVVLNYGTTWLNFTNNTVNENGLNDMDATELAAVGTLIPTLAVGVSNQIDAYLYINGDNPVVTSEHAANLASFKMSIRFGCTPGSQA